jgi:hypothetical protein
VTLAYLDPGSGSLIASALVGGVAAAGVAAKQARARFSAGFGRKRKQEDELSSDEVEDVTGDQAAAEQATTAETDAATADAGDTADKTAPVGSDN